MIALFRYAVIVVFQVYLFARHLRAIAHNKGIKIPFPISCHLFPIFKTDVTLHRITNYYKYINNDCNVFHLTSFSEYIPL